MVVATTTTTSTAQPKGRKRFGLRMAASSSQQPMMPRYEKNQVKCAIMTKE